jgi:DNA-binding XRE family transcriptional regulator
MGLSQIALANAIGLTRIQYGNIEKAKTSTTKKTALIISSHFKKTINELFNEKGSHYIAKKSTENSFREKSDNNIFYEIRPIE